MKGNISRESHRPEGRYSGVFQVQGGMVTDADLGEQAAIARRRADALGKDTAGSGVPVDGGAVRFSAGSPVLTEGVVYAEGVRGETRATAALTGPLSLYTLQSDFPLVPTLPPADDLLIYADVWERTVTRLEDPLLSDPGLHGAETSLRNRTMAQIKFAPAGQADALGDADGPLPRIGGGVLTVTPVGPETIDDDCDPCANEVKAEQTVVNALFRIEVVHVLGDPQTPDQIRIAWSDENASAIAPATVNSEDFSRAGAVYEFFSYASETHLGVHTANDQVARSSFGGDLVAGPVDPAAPEGGDWPFVRRWSGAASIDFGAGNAERVGGGGGVSVSGRRVTLTVDAFSAEIDFQDRPVVAGDYWLIETRRFAETPIRVVQDMPVGVRHHYCPLFRVSNGNIVALSDEETRRLSFPALADMPASHVAFDNQCPKLFDAAENVQEALDQLCEIEAADIAFDASDCPRLFDSTDNVQDALSNLCKLDFGTERLLRLLHDWGVVCGVIPARVANENSVISYSEGAILDRAGRLGDVKPTTLDLDKLVGTRFFHFADTAEFDKRLRAGQVCLGLAIGEGGEIETHLSPEDIAFGPPDPTLLSVFTECRETKPRFDPKDDFTVRPDLERGALDKVVYGAANPKLATSQRLDAKEQQVARSYNEDLVIRYKDHLKDDEASTRLDGRIKRIEETIDVEGATGEVRETRFLQRESAIYALVRETEAERLRRCLCDAMMPRCPTLGKPPFLVPIACLEGATEAGRIFLNDLCVACCRKQAMSWQMVQYYFAEIREVMDARVEAFCCPPEEDDDIVGPKPGGGFNLGDLDAQLTPEFFGVQAEKSVRILTGRNPPSDYEVKPRIDNLGVEQAKTALSGNGVVVAETIDVNDADAIRKIREASAGVEARDLVLDDGAVKPGDKVALIVQDGVAIDYVKLETGGGKFLFEKSAAIDSGLSPGLGTKADRSVTDLEARIKATEDAARAADADLGAMLETRRTEIANETEEASRELETIRANRDALNAELVTINKEIVAARGELTKINEEQKVAFAEVQKEHEAVITSIRREIPVTAVVDNDKLVSALARGGVTNIAELAALPDAELKEAATKAGVTLTSARSMKSAAQSKLKEPIR